MSKHSIRIGSDSRFSCSRSSSSASTRRNLFASAVNVSEASASIAFSWASSCRRRFSPRSGARTSTFDPRSSERNVASGGLARPRGTRICGGIDGADPVVLEAGLLEHLPHVLAGRVFEVERIAVDHSPAAEREDLNGGAVGADSHADHVDRPDRRALDRLPLGQPLDGAQPVAVARRIFEALLGRRLAHPPLELGPDGPVVPGEELDHVLDDRAIVVLRNVPDARRETPLDVEVEARNAAAPARLRSTRTACSGRPGSARRGSRGLLRVRIRPEVDDAAPVALAGERRARELVLDGDSDVRERLVVPKPHVERWPVPLHEVLLEVQRLDLGAGDDRLDLDRSRRELVYPGARVTAPAWKYWRTRDRRDFALPT